MTSEITHDLIGDEGSAHPTSFEGRRLSQAVFANPVDFLNTLKTILPKADAEHPDDVTRNDLIAYSSDGDNVRDRAAAAIAANHFDQIVRISDLFDPAHVNDISGKDVAIDLDMTKGNIKNRVGGAQIADSAEAALFGLGTVTMGFTTAAFPLAAWVSGATTVFLGAATVGLIAKAATEDKSAATEASQDQKLLASWPEINGRVFSFQ